MLRRSFITGLGALIAAPAIVRATSLMPVRGIVMPIDNGRIVLDQSPGLAALQLPSAVDLRLALQNYYYSVSMRGVIVEAGLGAYETNDCCFQRNRAVTDQSE